VLTELQAQHLLRTLQMDYSLCHNTSRECSSRKACAIAAALAKQRWDVGLLVINNIDYGERKPGSLSDE